MRVGDVLLFTAPIGTNDILHIAMASFACLYYKHTIRQGKKKFDIIHARP